MNYKDIVFLISSKTLIGVLESQVFNFADYIAVHYDYKVKIVLCGDEIFFDKDSYSEKLEFHYLNETISIREIKKSKIYIRTIDVFLRNYLQLQINKNYLIYDFRALLFAESFSRRKNYFIAALIFMLEMITCFLANQICCVSKNLRTCLFKFFNYKKNIYVFPCLVVNKERKKFIPSKYLAKKTSFVYLGSVTGWQNFDEAVDVYKQFSKNNKTSFTVITKDKKKAIKILKNKNVSGNVLSLKNSEVLIELQHYDFGFLLRENNLLNNVASPIKFLEYLNCGVIPIMNKGIGDYSNLAKVNDIAIVLDENNKLEKSEISRLIEDEFLDKRIEFFFDNNYNFENTIKNHPLIK